MAQFIDRRLNGKNKSTVNRQRFLRRYKEQIKESVADAVNRRSITNTESGEDVSIPTRDIKEPMFHQGKGGVRERVHPGNDQFIRGDKIDRPKGGQGSGGSGEGEASAMVKAAMISYSKFPKMNTSIFCLKIWRCRISRKTKLTKSPNGKPIAQVFKPRGFPPIFQWCVHCNNL